MSTTSGRSRSDHDVDRRRAPFSASATTSMPSAESRIIRNPVRIRAWSSTTPTTRMRRRSSGLRGDLEGGGHPAIPPPGRGVDVEGRRRRLRPARASPPGPDRLPVAGAGGRAPLPSSVTCTSKHVGGRSRGVTVARAGPACFRELVSDSCTMRYAVQLDAGGELPDAPRRSTTRSTGMPASSHCWTRRSKSSRPGAGTRSAVVVVVAEHPEHPAHLGERLATRGPRWLRRCLRRPDRDSCPGCTRRAAPACTTITLMEWATTSWSSLAMRVRSSVTARRASVSLVLLRRCGPPWPRARPGTRGGYGGCRPGGSRRRGRR